MLQTFEYLAMDEVISRNSQSADSKGIQWGSSLESQKWSPGADYSFRRAHVAYMFAKAMMSGNVPDESLDKLVKRFHEEVEMELKYLTGATACVLGFVAHKWRFVISLAEEIVRDCWHNHSAADVTLISGIPLPCTVPTIWWMSLLMSGEANHELARKALREAQRSLPIRDHVGPVVFMRSIESLWEPSYSQRVKQWRLKPGIESHSVSPVEWVIVEEYFRELNEMQTTADGFAHCLHIFEDRSPGTGESSVAEQLSSWVNIAHGLVEPTRISWNEFLLVLIRAFVFEILRVILPPETASKRISVRISSVGVQHMANAAQCLSECLQNCRNSGLNWSLMFTGSGRFAFAEAMCLWSQWWLGAAGFRSMLKRKEQLKSIAMNAQHVVGALLRAQLLSTESQDSLEVLPACIPATIALARLLMGDGIPDSTSCRGKPIQHTAYVPVKPCFGDYHEHIDVEVVRLGSQRALEVAKDHLRSALSLVTDNGQPIMYENARSPKDLSGSEVLWEAVSLLQMRSGPSVTSPLVK